MTINSHESRQKRKCNMMNRCKDQYILQHAGHTHTPGAGGNKDTGSSDESRPPEELYCVSLMFSPCSIPVLYAA